MARKTPRKTVRRAARKAPSRTEQGLRKARAGKAAKVKAAKLKDAGPARSRPTARPPPARCRRGPAPKSRKRSAAFRRRTPSPRASSQHVNPFTLLVAVVLSAQATDAGVNKATPALFAAADTPAKMAALGEARVQRPDQDHRAVPHQGEERRRAVAEARRRARRRGAARRARRSKRCPGVGRKTANVVLNMAFGEPTIAVDTHIFRIGNRTGLAPGKTPFEVETKLDEVVPAKYKRHAHHWLILHGRYVCVARRPLCEKCIIADLCKWPGKTVSRLNGRVVQLAVALAPAGGR